MFHVFAYMNIFIHFISFCIIVLLVIGVPINRNKLNTSIKQSSFVLPYLCVQAVLLALDKVQRQCSKSVAFNPIVVHLGKLNHIHK